MRFKTNAGAFAAAAAAAVSVAPEKSPVPILGTVLIKASDGLALTATDLDVWLTREVKSELQEPCAACVNAMHLRAFAETLDASAEIEGRIIDGRMLTLRSGRARCSLATLPAIDFPGFTTEGRFTHSLVLASKLFSEVIDKLVWSIHKEEIVRPDLYGAFLSREGRHVIMVSSNNQVLTFTKLGNIEGADGMPAVIVPPTTLSLLRKIGKEVETLVLDIGQSAIRATAGDTTLISRLIDATFPDYRRTVPPEIEHPLVLQRSAISAAVSRVMSIVEASKRGRFISVSVSSGIGTISGAGDAAHVEETIDAPHDQEVSFICNGIYLRNALRAISGEYIEIHQRRENSALLLKPHDGNGDFVVLSGMRC